MAVIRPKDEARVNVWNAGDTILLDGPTTRSILVDDLLVGLVVVPKNALGNGGNPVTADYVVTPSDAGKTLLANTGSPNALNTITLPPVSGFSIETVLTIINNDSTRGKMLSGFPSDLYPCLFPKQALQLRIVNGAWATSVNPGRWCPQVGVTLYVDPVLGLDTGTDGLAPGAGALKAIFHAFQVFQSVIACPAGANPTIQLPLGGGTSATSLTIANAVQRVAVTQAGLGYNGARVRLESLANRKNFMEGVCTYIGAVLTMTVDNIGGAGTFSDWVLSYVFTESPPNQILGAVPSGTGVVRIVGNETTPTACRWNSAGITVCDGAVLSLRGCHACTISSGQDFVTIGKGGIVVCANFSWGSAVGGANVLVKEGGKYVWDPGTYSVGDAATAPACFTNHIFNGGGYVSMEQSSAISVPYALTDTTFYSGQGPGSRATFGGGTSFTGPGSGVGSGGFKFAVQVGAEITLNGCVLPGTTAGISVNGFIDGVFTPPDLAPLFGALGGDVVTNAATFVDGPAVANGNIGTYEAKGHATVIDSAGPALFYVRIWDGSTTVVSGTVVTPGAGVGASLSLIGQIVNPSGNLRMSVKGTTATGKISAAGYGLNSSAISVTRVK